LKRNYCGGILALRFSGDRDSGESDPTANECASADVGHADPSVRVADAATLHHMLRKYVLSRPLRSTVACSVVFWLGTTAGSTTAQSSSATLPAGLETYLATEVHPSTAERQKLMSGVPITKLLPSDPAKEVAVFGAVWIDATLSSYVNQLKDIETFEKGGAFRITRRISDPPRPEDFAQLALTQDDFKDLRRCRPGDCDVKLSERGLETFRTQVRWGTTTESSDEFRTMIERAPSLARMPDLLTYLLEYPAATLSDSTDFMYWQEVNFGLKPTIRINHLVIQERPEKTVIASKMLYASHYFWTALELRILQRDPARGDGFWFVTISRSRADGLKGFLGRIIRGRVRAEARSGTDTALRVTKAKLERH
jgi:hypothetical protein